MFGSTVLSVVVATWLLMSAAAQEPCAPCAGRGERACRRCAVEREARASFCSVAAACPSCLGALATPCPTCKAAAERLTERRARVAASLEVRRGRLAPAKLATAPVLVASAHVELWFAPRALSDCPERDVHGQAHLFLDRLDAVVQRLAKLLALPPAQFTSAKLPVVAVVGDAGDLERLSAHLGTIEPQGAGVLDLGQRVALLQNQDGKDAALHRLAVHALAQVIVAPHLGDDSRAWDWLRIGLAHWLAADLTGACDAIPVLDRPQPATRFFGGDWRVAARELLEAQTLPDLDALLSTDASHYDLAAHATLFAAVDWLIGGASAAPHTGEVSTAEPLLARLCTAARAGRAPAEALGGLLPASGGKLAPSFEAWLRARYPRR